MRRPSCFRVAFALSLSFAALTVAGCNIVAPVFYLVHGPEKTKKVYALDAKRPTVVFVDDRANRVPRRTSRVLVAETAEADLLKQKVVKDVISFQSALVAAGNEKGGKPLPISEIGRSVNAEVVIYASVEDFYMSTDGQTYAPGARLRVKVVDCVTEARLWPDDPRKGVIEVNLPVRQGVTPTSTAERFAVEEDLARQCGQTIARLFYDHERQSVPRGAPE
jgi:hypothetical protein